MRSWLRAPAPGVAHGARQEARPAAAERGQPRAHVAVMLGAQQGQRHLADQVEALLAQRHGDWSLFVADGRRDPGSADPLQMLRRRLPATRLTIAPETAVTRGTGLLALLGKAPGDADHYAWLAQDDLWEADHLARAVAALAAVPAHVPALYCSRTRLVDAHDRTVGCSPPLERAPGFAHALVRNPGGGNTMVLNAAARALLLRAGEQEVASDAWWIHMAVTACGGRVLVDAQPSVRYRQPDHALAPAMSGLAWRRAKALLSGQLRTWSDKHLRALEALRGDLTPKNRMIALRFARARQQPLAQRLVGFRRAGVYRQGMLDNVALFAAAVLNKV
jgi:hypothetical protein